MQVEAAHGAPSKTNRHVFSSAGEPNSLKPPWSQSSYQMYQLNILRAEKFSAVYPPRSNSGESIV